MQVEFGVGTVIGRRTDVSPIQNFFFGVTQEWSLELNQELVKLLGQYKTPVDIADGELDITGKIKFARMQASAIGNFLLGVTPTSSAGFDLIGPENHQTIATTTFTVTNGTTFLEDLGVFYHSSGIALQPVASNPTTGQYVPGVSGTGTYTIASGDESASGGLDVYYLDSLTSLYEVDYNQALMGTGPVIELDFSVPYAFQGTAKKFNVQCYAAKIGKTAFDFKNKNYMIPEMDFQLMANPSGQVMRFALSE